MASATTTTGLRASVCSNGRWRRCARSGTPDFPYCFCWANENWTRRWDGAEREILIAQNPSPADDERLIRDLLPHFRDPRYIRVDGKPLFIVYRVGVLPDVRASAAIWRDVCRREGIGELYLCAAKTYDTGDPSQLRLRRRRRVPAAWRAHAADQSAGAISSTRTSTGQIVDYRQFVLDSLARPEPPYTRAPHRDARPGTTRRARPNHALTFVNATPEIYELWLREIVARAAERHQGDERLVFINAWNEWAEARAPRARSPVRTSIPAQATLRARDRSERCREAVRRFTGRRTQPDRAPAAELRNDAFDNTQPFFDPRTLPNLTFFATGGTTTLVMGESEALIAALAATLAQRFPRGARVGLLYRSEPTLPLMWLAALHAGLEPLILQYPTEKQSLAAWRFSVDNAVRSVRLAGLICSPELQRFDVGAYNPLFHSGDVPANLDAPSRLGSLSPDAAILQMSSGTTGQRKAIRFTLRQVGRHADDYNATLGLRANDRIVSWLPLYHDMGFIACFVMPMLLGVPVAMIDPIDWVRRPAHCSTR